MFRFVVVFIFTLVFIGCESRARYSAEFIAQRSRLSSKVLSAVVYENAETMVNNRGYSLMRICPEKGQTGKELELQASIVRHDPDGNPIVELSHDGKNYSWSWGDSSPLLKILHNSAYTNLNDFEIKRLNQALFNSLSSPKGFVLEKQGRGIFVKNARIERNARFNSSMRYNKWIEQTGLKTCA